MMINPILISLTENDKRIIFALLIVVILVLALIGYLSYLLVKMIKWQGKKIETLTADAVNTRVVIDPRHLRRYGRKKNWALFFKQALPPIIIAIIGAIVLIIRNSIYNDFAYDIFSVENGFGSIFFTWKLSGDMTGTEFDLIRFNIIVVDNYPHFVLDAWASYISAPCFLVAGAWYFIVASSLLARTIHLQIVSRTKFEKEIQEIYKTNNNPTPTTNQNPNP